MNPFTTIKRQNTFFRGSLAATRIARAETADTKRMVNSYVRATTMEYRAAVMIFTRGSRRWTNELPYAKGSTMFKTYRLCGI